MELNELEQGIPTPCAEVNEAADDASDAEATADANAVVSAEERLAAAKTRLLAASVRTGCAGLGLTPRAADAAKKLVDFSGCVGTDGLPDDAAVAAALGQFKRDYPEFVMAAPPPFAVGTGTACMDSDAFRQKLGI